MTQGSLGGMAALRQWLLWHFAPHPKRPGAYTKVPLVSVTDPAGWTTYVDASARALASQAHADPLKRLYPGFVFTGGDPYYFTDLDHCRDIQSGRLTPYAEGVLALYSGAFVAVSSSGTGLHIFAQHTGPWPPHRSKAQGIELYHENRFVAYWPHIETQGSADTQIPMETLLAALPALERPDTAAPGNPGNSSAPDPRWRGPSDDEELLRRMFSAAPKLLGGGATPRQLFEGDTSQHGGDQSAADLALMAHLGFWTGYDRERMRRLFSLSELGQREKWTSREDYQDRTLDTVLNGPRGEVYQGRTEDGPPADAGITESPILGERWLTLDAQRSHFKDCTYIADAHAVLMPDGLLTPPSTFRVLKGGYTFPLDAGAKAKSTRNAFEAFTESQLSQFPRATSTVFRPRDPFGTLYTEEGLSSVNSYLPIDTPSTPGDITPFLEHMARVVPDLRDREILLVSMAAVVQHPGVKFQWAILLQGVEGNGKSLFIRVLMNAVGRRYSHKPNPLDIGNKFNAWARGKIFIGVEEIYQPGRFDIVDTMKTLITEDSIEIQGKGDNQVVVEVCGNFMLCSNHKDAVRKTANDRRYCVIYTAQQTEEDLRREFMNDKYFTELYRWLREDGGQAHVTHYLQTLDIASSQFNPATICQRAPVTTSTAEAIEESHNATYRHIRDAIDAGQLGFRGGWIMGAALDAHLDSVHCSRSWRTRKQALEDLGYIWHPALPEGRLGGYIDHAGSQIRPVLYIHRESLRGQLAADQVRGQYLTDQDCTPQLAAVQRVDREL